MKIGRLFKAHDYRKFRGFTWPYRFFADPSYGEELERDQTDDMLSQLSGPILDELRAKELLLSVACESLDKADKQRLNTEEAKCRSA